MRSCRPSLRRKMNSGPFPADLATIDADEYVKITSQVCRSLDDGYFLGHLDRSPLRIEKTGVYSIHPHDDSVRPQSFEQGTPIARCKIKMKMTLKKSISITKGSKTNRHPSKQQVAIAMFPFTYNLTTEYIHVEIPDLFPSLGENREGITTRMSQPCPYNLTFQTHIKLPNRHNP